MGGDTYSHGHHDSVLRSHRWRTAENSAAYLLPELRPGMRLLDIGCGPGNLTVDLGRRVAPGEAIGIDIAPEIVEIATRDAAATGASNVRFAVGDAYDLRAHGLALADGGLDVVHAHQVLQHLSDPIGALREWRRVLGPDGLLAARDTDYGSMVWAPADPMLDRWNELIHDLTRENNANADAGRHLLRWAQRAGFTRVEQSGSSWVFADPETRAWWGGLWAERVLESSFAEQTVAYGLSDRSELEAIAAAWRRWSEQPDGVFMSTAGEVLARP